MRRGAVGHPEYYARFGFQPASRHRLASQWEGMPDAAFMALVLDRHAMEGTAGVANYRDEFNNVVERPPQFLLIVRERLRPGSDEAYNENELQLAAACATLHCPHPYLALASMAGPREVWWLNAFASQAERDAVGPAYARNEALMAALRPLGKRKEDFRESLITTMTKHRPDVSRGAGWRIAGSRFVAISITRGEGASVGAVFESPDGERFALASANSQAVAKDLAAHLGPGTTILAVQPQWSFPADAWIDADPDFWSANAVARNRHSSREHA